MVGLITMAVLNHQGRTPESKSRLHALSPACQILASSMKARLFPIAWPNGFPVPNDSTKLNLSFFPCSFTVEELPLASTGLSPIRTLCCTCGSDRISLLFSIRVADRLVLSSELDPRQGSLSSLTSLTFNNLLVHPTLPTGSLLHLLLSSTLFSNCLPNGFFLPTHISHKHDFFLSSRHTVPAIYHRQRWRPSLPVHQERKNRETHLGLVHREQTLHPVRAILHIQGVEMIL